MTTRWLIQLSLAVTCAALAAPAAVGASVRAYLVRDVWPGPDSSLIQHMAVGAGHLWFVAVTNEGTSLWHSDGTPTGTHLVRTFYPTVVGPEGPLEGMPNEITGLGDVVLFTAGDDETGEELWRSDGTFAGTYMIKEIWTGVQYGSPGNYANVVTGLTPLANSVVFQARDDWYNWEPWVSDGTATGTLQLADVVPGPEGLGVNFLSIGDRAVFFVEPQLWSTDGTPAGTGLIAELDTTNSRTPATTQGFCFFVNGQQIWRTDGSTGGTGVLLNLGVDANARIRLNGRTDAGLFFSRQWAPPSNYAYEIWFSDFDGLDPRIVYSYDSGSTECCDGIFPGGIATTKDFFFGGHLANEMWASDGTVAGTRKVVDFAAIGITAIDSMAHMDDLLFFHGTDAAHGEEWWWSDGTDAGVRPLDINPGPEGTAYGSPVAMDGRFYVRADDGVDGLELWAIARVGVSAFPIAASTSGDSGGSATLSVALESKPLRDVTVPIASADATEADVSPSSLTFTPDNWDNPQLVTVSSLGDEPVPSSVVVGPEQSDDPAYAGLGAITVNLSTEMRPLRRHLQRQDTPKPEQVSGALLVPD